MGWFVSLLRCCLHALQLGCAIAAWVFYASTYDRVTKDYRWNFAITTCAFSIAGIIIQSIFRGFFLAFFDLDWYDFWALLSAECSFILFVFWTGVLGTFARSFIHRDASDNNGIRMMQIAVYVDAANMVIWCLTVLDMCAGIDSSERRLVRRNIGGLYPSAGHGANPPTPFVPYGWDAEDIEAQTLAVQIENSLLHPTIETQAAHLSIPHSILPELPPRVVTTERGRNVTHSRDIEPMFHLEAYSAFTGFESPKSSPGNGFWPWPFEWDEPTKECPICVEERPCWTEFPFRIAKACSNHKQEACRGCIDRSIVAELDSNISGPIHCAECRAVLDYEEVKALASPTTFVRYERMGIRGFVNDNPNFVWCQNRDCPSGQEHVGGEDQPMVTCQECGFKTCFKHQIPWHDEMLCDEYDERVRLSNNERQSRAQQELASIRAIHEVTKPCANKDCKAPIQKTQGCDHMTCWRCKYEFCWMCGGDWKGSTHRLGCGFRT